MKTNTAIDPKAIALGEFLRLMNSLPF